MSDIALDTNILVYGHSGDDRKKQVGRSLLKASPVISSQVISEYLNVMQRVFKKEKNVLIQTTALLLRKCIIKPIILSTVELAADLIGRYDFQLFDGVIVASALEAGCNILYSADMQDGLIVDGTLKIANPYV
ncbi:MAG: PIN domain-containing protein [Chitinispirillales bacterium]|jgi:predicted nucleic acid-binding protein|nr:PIN domain-containing protein [Chitinispirillales bacterium]